MRTVWCATEAEISGFLEAINLQVKTIAHHLFIPFIHSLASVLFIPSILSLPSFVHSFLLHSFASFTPSFHSFSHSFVRSLVLSCVKRSLEIPAFNRTM